MIRQMHLQDKYIISDRSLADKVFKTETANLFKEKIYKSEVIAI